MVERGAVALGAAAPLLCARPSLAEGGNAATNEQAVPAEQPAATAAVRTDSATAAPELRELGRKELDMAAAFLAALAEELARQIGLARCEELVDPVVDLAKELGPAARFHAPSVHLLSLGWKVQAPGITDDLRNAVVAALKECA
jgi:hypothetical protein